MNALQNLTAGVRRALRLEAPQPPEPELLRIQPKPMVGFFATLSPEQKAKALAFRGEQDFGDPSVMADVSR
jgi:hypothetical protein